MIHTKPTGKEHKISRVCELLISSSVIQLIQQLVMGYEDLSHNRMIMSHEAKLGTQAREVTF